MRYKLPLTFTKSCVDRPGNPDGSLHLCPGKLVELSESDVALIKKNRPDIARGMTPQPVKIRFIAPPKPEPKYELMKVEDLDTPQLTRKEKKNAKS